MIETPSASLIAISCSWYGFLLIGTNDLISYTMCADHGNDRVACLYGSTSHRSPFHSSSSKGGRSWLTCAAGSCRSTAHPSPSFFWVWTGSPSLHHLSCVPARPVLADKAEANELTAFMELDTAAEVKALLDVKLARILVAKS